MDNDLFECSPSLNTFLKSMEFKFYSNEPTSITYAVICKNEENVIEDTLKSIELNLDQEDELIVIDTGSTDETLDIINNQFEDAKLYHYKWHDDFSAVRNFALSKADKQWIYFIDADEVLLQKRSPLKKVMRKLNDFKGNITIRPIIINHDSHIIVGVDRIFRVNSNLRFYGYVHEELRENINDYYPNIDYAVVNNNILEHTGYVTENVQNKNKVNRNINLLERNIKAEPEHIKWNYFMSRDGKSVFSEDEQFSYLTKALNICKKNNFYNSPFYFRIISDIISNRINYHKIEEAEKYLELLNESESMKSDYIYYKELLNLIKYRINLENSLRDLSDFRKNSGLSLGNLHSNNFHIDNLISLYFSALGDYESSISIAKKLEKENFDNLINHFKDIQETLRQLL